MALTSIFIIALFVSVDSFFVGMFTTAQKGFKVLHLSLMALVVAAFCFLAYGLSALIAPYINFELGYIAGAIFVCIGVSSVLSNPEEVQKVPTLKNVFLFGALLAADGMVAVVSVTMVRRTVLMPIAVSLVHLVFSFIGSLVALKVKTNPTVRNWIAGGSLIILGWLNILEVL